MKLDGWNRILFSLFAVQATPIYDPGSSAVIFVDTNIPASIPEQEEVGSAKFNQNYHALYSTLILTSRYSTSLEILAHSVIHITGSACCQSNPVY